jgi:hypothetical protein
MAWRPKAYPGHSSAKIRRSGPGPPTTKAQVRATRAGGPSFPSLPGHAEVASLPPVASPGASS